MIIANITDIVWPNGHEDLPFAVSCEVECEECSLKVARRDTNRSTDDYLTRRFGVAPISFTVELIDR